MKTVITFLVIFCATTTLSAQTIGDNILEKLPRSISVEKVLEYYTLTPNGVNNLISEIIDIDDIVSVTEKVKLATIHLQKLAASAYSDSLGLYTRGTSDFKYIVASICRNVTMQMETLKGKKTVANLNDIFYAGVHAINNLEADPVFAHHLLRGILGYFLGHNSTCFMSDRHEHSTFMYYVFEKAIGDARFAAGYHDGEELLISLNKIIENIFEEILKAVSPLDTETCTVNLGGKHNYKTCIGGLYRLIYTFKNIDH